MDSRLLIYSLGGLTLHYEGQAVTGLSSRKMEALMAYLAYTGRLHSREHLADLFWTDSPIETGLANLRVVLSRLRKIFPEHLIATRQTVGIVEGLLWHDANELGHTLGEALAQWRHSGRILPALLGQAEAQLPLYKGLFMAGLALKEADAFDAWLSHERERLQALVMEASFVLAELYQSQNSHENAKRHLQNALRIDPLEERSYRQLMQVYWQTGQTELAVNIYEQLAQTFAIELGSEPSQESLVLFKRIQSKESPQGQRQNIPLRLPHDSSIFVGRQRELADITSRLRDEACRLLTILGLGGIGKTRLAIAAARILASDSDSFPDGIYFVPLEDVPASMLIPSIGAVLGRDAYSVENMTQLVNFLSERKILLLLDNIEDLAEEAAATLSHVLEAAPKLKILITSRERLHLREEWLYDLHGLHCPESENSAVLEASEAVQMLHSASKQVGIQLNIHRYGQEIVSLCRLVDGMPLALEMLASLLRDFGLEQLLQRIESSMDLLRSNLRNTPQRQISLRLLFDSVWERLSQSEKTILLRLSVFTGYISKEAAIAVANASSKDLIALQNRLLLREAEMGRFSLHPLLRQYAFEKLAAETPKLIESQEKHAVYFSDFVSSRANAINSHQFRPACDALELEIDNIRSAWLYSAKTSSAARLQAMLHPLANYHSLMERNRAGVLLFEEAAEANLPRGLKAWLFAYQASFLLNLKEFGSDKLEMLLDNAENLFKAAHEREGFCFVLLRRAFQTFTGMHKSPEALQLLDQAEALAKSLRHQDYLMDAILQRGSIISRLGRTSEAEPYFQQVLAMNPQDPKLYADCLLRIGTNYYRRQDFSATLTHLEQVLDFDSKVQFELHYANTLILYGSALMGLDRMTEAEQSFLQSLSFYSKLKHVGAMATCHERLASCYQQMRRLDEALYHLGKAKEFCAIRKEWRGYIQLLNNFSLMFQELSWAHPAAREAYQEALAVGEREGDTFNRATSVMAAGLIELLFGNYPLAYEYLKQSISLHLEEDNWDGLRQSAQGFFRYAIQTEQIEFAAWLKQAFAADEDTDNDIKLEIEAVGELPHFDFSPVPNLAELETIAANYALSSVS